MPRCSVHTDGVVTAPDLKRAPTPAMQFVRQRAYGIYMQAPVNKMCNIPYPYIIYRVTCTFPFPKHLPEQDSSVIYMYIYIYIFCTFFFKKNIYIYVRVCVAAAVVKG